MHQLGFARTRNPVSSKVFQARSLHSNFCSSFTLRTSDCKMRVVDLPPFPEWENWKYQPPRLVNSSLPLRVVVLPVSYQESRCYSMLGNRTEAHGLLLWCVDTTFFSSSCQFMKSPFLLKQCCQVSRGSFQETMAGELELLKEGIKMLSESTQTFSHL